MGRQCGLPKSPLAFLSRRKQRIWLIYQSLLGCRHICLAFFSHVVCLRLHGMQGNSKTKNAERLRQKAEKAAARLRSCGRSVSMDTALYVFGDFWLSLLRPAIRRT
jgi:hypothetical protein